MKTKQLEYNERIIRKFLWKRKTLINGSHRFRFVKIFQRYQWDNGYSSGTYKGWHWEDICFEYEDDATSNTKL